MRINIRLYFDELSSSKEKVNLNNSIGADKCNVFLRSHGFLLKALMLSTAFFLLISYFIDNSYAQGGTYNTDDLSFSFSSGNNNLPSNPSDGSLSAVNDAMKQNGMPPSSSSIPSLPEIFPKIHKDLGIRKEDDKLSYPTLIPKPIDIDNEDDVSSLAHGIEPFAIEDAIPPSIGNRDALGEGGAGNKPPKNIQDILDKVDEGTFPLPKPIHQDHDDDLLVLGPDLQPFIPKNVIDPPKPSRDPTGSPDGSLGSGFSPTTRAGAGLPQRPEYSTRSNVNPDGPRFVHVKPVDGHKAPLPPSGHGSTPDGQNTPGDDDTYHAAPSPDFAFGDTEEDRDNGLGGFIPPAPPGSVVIDVEDDNGYDDRNIIVPSLAPENPSTAENPAPPQIGVYNPKGTVYVLPEDAGGDLKRAKRSLDFPSDKGLWRYDLYDRSAVSNANEEVGSDSETDTADNVVAPAFTDNGANAIVLASRPDREAFEVHGLISAAQNIFHQSATIIDNRQVKFVPDGHLQNGFWLQGLGSYIERNKNDSFTLYGETSTYDVSYKQKTYGMLIGFDHVYQGLGSKNGYLTLGAYGGFLKSDLGFNGSSTTADYSGGTLGVYASYQNDGFHVDLLAKTDILQTKWEAPSLAQFDPDETRLQRTLNGQNVGGSLGVGYKFVFGEKSYFDPFAKLAYVRTSYDAFEVIGTDIAPGQNDSMRGEFGARLGTSFKLGASEYNIFTKVAYVKEYLAKNKVIFTSSESLELVSNNQFSAVHVGAGLNISFAHSGMSAFARANAEIGDEYNSYSGKVGIDLKF